jgi:hypothetical protein
LAQSKLCHIILDFKNTHGRWFTKREDMDRICHDFYTNLYMYHDISK